MQNNTKNKGCDLQKDDINKRTNAYKYVHNKYKTI